MAFQVEEMAYDLITALGPLVPHIKRHDRALADQLTRAASSVALNIAESNYSDAGNRRARLAFRIDFTIDVVRTLTLTLCAVTATRRPLLGALTAAGLVAAALVIQFFVLHQPLGFSVWSSLLQGIAIGYGFAAASKASRLHSKLSAGRTSN